MRNIKSYCSKNEMQFKYCNNVLNDIVNRLDEDKEFQRRQNLVGFFAKNLKKFGLLNLLNNHIFYSFHPYMKVEITKKKSNEKN